MKREFKIKRGPLKGVYRLEDRFFTIIDTIGTIIFFLGMAFIVFALAAMS